VKEYRAQVADWKAYRARLAGAPAETREASPGVSGRITSRIDDKAAAEPKDVVRLSKGEAPGPGGAGSGAADRIRSLEEEVAARDKALKEANERVAQLEKTIKDMQRLAEIKSAGMAAAQQQAQAKSEAKPEAATPASTPAAKTEDTAAPKPVPEKATEQPAPKPPADKAKATADVKKAPPAPPAPSVTDTLIDNAPYLGGGAIALLGLGYWLMRRRRQEPAAEIAATAVPGAVQTPEQPAAAEEPLQATADVELDPIEEANVYITHGRDAQAEAVLTDAIAKEPAREALHVKLLEVYALRKDKATFAKRAEELHKLTGGRGDNWLKVAAMGAGLDPGNLLYARAGDVSVATPVPEGAGADLDFNLDVPATEAESRTSAPAPATPDIELEIPADEPRATPPPAESGTIDFEIEVPKLDVPPAAPAPAASAEADSAPALDFKLDLGALDLSTGEKKPAAVVPAQAGERDAHWHDVQAKFDLAKAYQEMGDKAGASDILKEVVQEGDAEQKVRARTLLDSLE
jgi:pilus assembly protein FimV